MSAARLREAAEVMHNRVDDVWEYHSGRWSWSHGYSGHREIYAHNEVGEEDATFVVSWDTSGTSEFIAAMSPTLGLAIAGWLDQHASEHGINGCGYITCRALAVADAILGDDS